MGEVLRQGTSLVLLSYVSGIETLRRAMTDDDSVITSYASGIRTLQITDQSNLLSSNNTISGINTSLINLNIYASGIETMRQSMTTGGDVTAVTTYASGIETLRRAMVSTGTNPELEAYASGTETLTILNQSDITRIETCTSGIYQSQFYLRNRTDTNLPNARMLGYDAKYIANTVDIQAGMQDYEEWTINPDVIAYWSGSQTIGQANQVDINLLQNYASGIETMRQAMVGSVYDDSVITSYASGTKTLTNTNQNNATALTAGFSAHTNDADAHHPTLHDIASIVAHYSSATPTKILMADVNGLPSDASMSNDVLISTISGVGLVTAYASGTRTLEITMQNTATGLNTYASGIETLRRAMVTTTSAELPRGYIDGLILSNDSGDTAHDIAIAIGECRDSTDAKDIANAAILTKRIDAGWGVGDDQGGMDTGSVGNSSWYHVWLIIRSDTGVVDALFSLSATAPTMPANYDYKRRLGSVLTNGSANIIAFIQMGEQFLWLVPKADATAAAIGTAAVTLVISTPLGVKTFPAIGASVAKTSATPSMYISSLDVTDGAVDVTINMTDACPVASVGANSRTHGEGHLHTSTASAIRAIASLASSQYWLYTFGWIDPRGKDA